jgi:hypothetical protein
MKLAQFEYKGITGTACHQGAIIYVTWGKVSGHLRSLMFCMDDAFFDAVQRAIVPD